MESGLHIPAVVGEACMCTGHASLARHQLKYSGTHACMMRYCTHIIYKSIGLGDCQICGSRAFVHAHAWPVRGYLQIVVNMNDV